MQIKMFSSKAWKLEYNIQVTEQDINDYKVTRMIINMLKRIYSTLITHIIESSREGPTYKIWIKKLWRFTHQLRIPVNGGITISSYNLTYIMTTLAFNCIILSYHFSSYSAISKKHFREFSGKILKIINVSICSMLNFQICELYRKCGPEQFSRFAVC